MNTLMKKVHLFVIIILIITSVTYKIFATNIQTNNIDSSVQNNQTNINNLQNKYNEVQEQAEQANNELSGVQTVLSDTMQQIQALNDKIETYQDEINLLNENTTKLRISIEELEPKLAKAQANYNEKKKILEKRLIVLYETNQTTYLDVLLNSKSITDFLSRYFFITQIAEYDSKILEEAELEKTSIEVAKNTLDSQKEKFRAAKDNVEKTAILLENTRVVKNSYINKLTDEEKALQEKIDIFNKQMKELETEIVLLTTANIGSDYIGGPFIWPVPGYTTISSPFGMRVHPITGVYKLHTGTDVPAPKGTNFLAMNSGTVIKAGFNAAYGNMVIIDHGGGIATVYAHGDEVLVSLGQEVKQGEPVLKVGSTGYATGPHAHFEIRINGEYIDPMKYVKP